MPRAHCRHATLNIYCLNIKSYSSHPNNSVGWTLTSVRKHNAHSFWWLVGESLIWARQRFSPPMPWLDSGWEGGRGHREQGIQLASYPLSSFFSVTSTPLFGTSLDPVPSSPSCYSSAGKGMSLREVESDHRCFHQ